MLCSKSFIIAYSIKNYAFFHKGLREIGKKHMPEDEAKYKVIEAELQSLYLDPTPLTLFVVCNSGLSP